MLINLGVIDIFLGLGNAAVLDNGICLEARGGQVTFDSALCPTEPINAITANGTQEILIQEFDRI